MNWIEMVGYLGSFLVLISFLMTSVAKLRIVNTVGSVIFAIYALIIRSYPTALMNICLVLINLHFLWKMRSGSKSYELVRSTPGDAFLQYLLTRFGEDIEEIFPGAIGNAQDANSAYVLTHESTPVGIALGKRDGDVLELELDYSMPGYRDFSLGGFLFNELKKDGVQTVVYNGPSQNHGEYLAHMGFVKQGGRYVKRMGEDSQEDL